MSLKVFTAAEALDAFHKNPENFLIIEEKKKDPKKLFQGTKFLNAYYNINEHKRKEGWFSIEDVELTVGVVDPTNQDDARSQNTGMRMQLQTSLEKGGDFAELLYELDPVWKKKVDELAEKKLIAKTNRIVHGLLQTHYSERNEEHAGEELETPIIRFKMDFGKFPPAYPHKFLANKQKTQIFDYDKTFIDKNGRKQYKLATVTNDDGVEEELNIDNMHLFLTKGSVIKKGRISMPSVSAGQVWISLRINLVNAIIQKGPDHGFSDDFENVSDSEDEKNNKQDKKNNKNDKQDDEEKPDEVDDDDDDEDLDFLQDKMNAL